MTENISREMSFAEHNEMEGRVTTALKNREFDAVLVTDAANITYCLGGRSLPYLGQRQEYPVAVLRAEDRSADSLICPSDLEPLARQLGWKGHIDSYGRNDGIPKEVFIKTIFKAIGRSPQIKKIAVDLLFTSHSLFTELNNNSDSFSFVDDNGLLRALRAIKTDGEVRMLEFAARLADRALVSALNHSEGSARDLLSYSMWEFMERIRVHVGEFGGSTTGNLTAVQGELGRMLYAKAPLHEALRPGETLRAEWTNDHRGYWTSAGRTMSVGDVSDQLKDSYALNQEIKQSVIDAFVPGVTPAELCEIAEKQAKKVGVTLWSEPGIGHGVGVSEQEGPYLTPDNKEPLQAGMVLTVSIYTRGPDEELIVDKDVRHITDDGSEKLNWYKDFQDIYEFIGTSARHG